MSRPGAELIPSRVTRPHGNSGVVKGKFRTNLPAKVFGASCRIVSRLDTLAQAMDGPADRQMLYPSTI